MVRMLSCRRRGVQRIAILFGIVCAGVYIFMAYITSLYTTVPAIVPFWSSAIPAYTNRWTYTRPEVLRQPNPAFNAAFVTFVGDDHESLAKLRRTIRDLEDNFNGDVGYPYIVFSMQELKDEFKELASSLTKGDMVFETLDKDMYWYTSDIDQWKALQSRRRMRELVVAGDNEEYRFRARFMAGMLFRHPAMQSIDYYWRFDPGSEYVCPIESDPFQYMHDNQKILSYSIALHEPQAAIISLEEKMEEFLKTQPEGVQPFDNPESLWKFAGVKGSKFHYNRCEFVSSFQINKVQFFKSPQYQAFFDFIDEKGGIFYERWSDSVIQSLGAILFLEKKDIHQWTDIGYRSADSLQNCPTNNNLWHKCDCRPERNLEEGETCVVL